MSTRTLGRGYAAMNRIDMRTLVLVSALVLGACTGHRPHHWGTLDSVEIRRLDAKEMAAAADRFMLALLQADSAALHRLSASDTIPLWQVDDQSEYARMAGAWLRGRRIRDGVYDDSTSATITFLVPLRTMPEHCYIEGGEDTLGFTFSRDSGKWLVAGISRPIC